MRVHLSDIMERGEAPLLLFSKTTGVFYEWDAGGLGHERRVFEGYAAPIGDSIVREQLKQIHVGCGGLLTDADMDQLDSVFRIAGVPWVVDRSDYWGGSTENAVLVVFPAWSEQVPLEGSRLEKWRPYWGKRAMFVWWNCENGRERVERESAWDDAAADQDYLLSMMQDE